MSDEGNGKRLWQTLRREGSDENEKKEKSDTNLNRFE